MEIYNQKRKLDNQKRKNNPQLYLNIMLELLASGLSRKQAMKKVKAIIQRETLELLNNEKNKPAAKVTLSVKYRAILNEEKIKSDPWHIAKVKQDEINQAKNEQKR